MSITIREYADKHKVTYEAIRKQVNRLSGEGQPLDGHIRTEGRTQFLDEYAESFLDERRAKNPIIIYETGKDEKIEELEQANKNLLLELAETKTKLNNALERQIEMQQEQHRLELIQSDAEMAKKRVEELENTVRTKKDEIDQVKIRLQQAEMENAQLIQDAQTASMNEEALTMTQIRAETAEKDAAAEKRRAEEAEKRARELEEENRRLKTRGFFARLFNL